jgi:hypothetical protein
VRLAEQWRRIQSDLTEDWSEARLAVRVHDQSKRSRANALLGPANPGQAGEETRISVSRAGRGTGTDAARRLFARLDREGIRATLRLVDSSTAVPAVVEPRPTLTGAWDAAVASLPPDWSDLYCELELTSSDFLDRGALLLAPVNPYRDRSRSAFHFRVAHQFGYGASGPMTRRCLERLDEDRITGRIRILRALSDTHNVATQGPVWYAGGKAI